MRLKMSAFLGFYLVVCALNTFSNSHFIDFLNVIIGIINVIVIINQGILWLGESPGQLHHHITEEVCMDFEMLRFFFVHVFF